MQAEKPRIGYIGLGLMGKPIAGNLLKAGYSLTVHSRQPRAGGRALRSLGAQVAETPRGVAEASDFVFTSLPDSPDVEQVVLGDQGCPPGLPTRDGVRRQQHDQARDRPAAGGAAGGGRGAGAGRAGVRRRCGGQGRHAGDHGRRPAGSLRAGAARLPVDGQDDHARRRERRRTGGQGLQPDHGRGDDGGDVRTAAAGAQGRRRSRGASSRPSAAAPRSAGRWTSSRRGCSPASGARVSRPR